MADLYNADQPKKQYWDKQTYSSLEHQLSALKATSTLYIGNLSFFTVEPQIYELFSSVGVVKKVIMGLDRFKKTPCGFCFVEFETHSEAVAAVNYLSCTKLDDRVIRCELDGGFKEGRQFGRGNSGGQVRDDRRSKDDYDPGRGGFGKATGSRSFTRGGDFPRKRQRSMDIDESANKMKKQKNDMTEQSGLGGKVNTIKEEEKNPRFRHDDDENEKDDEIIKEEED